MLSPRLNKYSYIFCTYNKPIIKDIDSISVFKESEGYTHIIRKIDADKLKINYKDEWAWITLDYYSNLDMTGITAAFSNALSSAGIACNVIAAFYHDHIFVPRDRQQDAMNILEKIEIKN